MAAGGSVFGSGAVADAVVFRHYARRIPQHQATLPRPGHVGGSKHRRDSWLSGTMRPNGAYHCGAHERPRGQPRRASSFRERNNVRRSSARSMADSVARQTRQKMISHPVSHIDFVPTLLDLLGQSNHPQCAGKSLLLSINDEITAPQNVFLEWAPNRTKVKKGSGLARRRMIKRAVEESTRTVVSPDGWKLCLRDKDSNELYNLNDDPFETRNLYSNRQYAAVISHLAGQIHRWQDSTSDRLKL